MATEKSFATARVLDSVAAPLTMRVLDSVVMPPTPSVLSRVVAPVTPKVPAAAVLPAASTTNLSVATLKSAVVSRVPVMITAPLSRAMRSGSPSIPSCLSVNRISSTST